MQSALWSILGLAVGLVPFFVYWLNIRRAKSTAQEVLDGAQVEIEKSKEAAEADLTKKSKERREQMESDLNVKREEQLGLERRLTRKEDNLDRKFDLLGKKENYLESKEKSLNKRGSLLESREEEVERVIEEEKQTLFRLTELGKDEAERLLLQKLEREFEHEKDTLIARTVERIKETAEARSRDILATTMQRMASSYCQEITTSNIEIPNDEMKGRVIGREGRNIRAFEQATGVDVIVDDTPGVIILSCFDSIRRAMAKRSMDKLIADGRIHPARIE